MGHGSRMCLCVNCAGTQRLPQSTAFLHEQRDGIADVNLSSPEPDPDSENGHTDDNDDASTIRGSQIERGSDHDDDAASLSDLEEFDEDETTMAIEHFSRQLLELVSDRLITEKGLELSLKVVAQYMQHIWPDADFSEAFPTTYYMLKKYADSTGDHLKEALSSSEILDVCVNECHVYEGDLAEAKSCPTCHEPRSSERQMLVFDVLGRLRSMWEVPQMRKLFRYPA